MCDYHKTVTGDAGTRLKNSRWGKAGKDLDFTGFDGNMLGQNLKTKKGSLVIMEEKITIATNQATALTAATATAEETSAEETAATSTATTTAEQAECVLSTVSSSADEAGTANFSIPISSLDTLNKMTCLIGELYTYSYLINKATGATNPALFIDSRMCDDLAEAITADEFLTVMKEFITATDYVRGIELKDGNLVFTCFENLQDTGMKNAAASLFRLIAKSITAKTSGKRLNLHKVEVKRLENEKFAFRSWLTKLGWKGAEGKMERNLLYRNLNGNTAFCTEESKIRWEAKHKKGKGSERTEPTVSEAVPTAEDESEAVTVAESETDIEVAGAVAF